MSQPRQGDPRRSGAVSQRPTPAGVRGPQRPSPAGARGMAQRRPVPQNARAPQQRWAAPRLATPPNARPPQRRSAPRPAPARAPRGNHPFARFPDSWWKTLAAGLLICAISFVGQYIWPGTLSGQKKGASADSGNAVAVVYGAGPIRLNELMSSNSGTCVDENGLASDWVEVANVSGHAVDLSGYKLAKNDRAVNVFTFPQRTLQPGECALVFADSTSGSGAMHAPFRLSSQGGTLMLFSPGGTAIDTINYPALASDTSYARGDQFTWSVTDACTPGLQNTQENYQRLHTPRTDAEVEITEIVASNTRYAPDSNGAYHDYVELHNRSGAAVDLSGWFLSDDPSRPGKWRFPDGYVLQPDERRIVYASGLDRRDVDPPHANFGFSTEGESAVLSDAEGRLVDSVTYGLMKRNQAYLKGADGAWTIGEPSPGR